MKLGKLITVLERAMKVTRVAAAICVLVISAEAYAQSGFAQNEINRLQSAANANSYSADALRTQVLNRAVPRVPGVSSNVIAGALGRPNKPFSSISRGPSVTPYLAFDQPFSNTATQYYTQVRPQLEQQRMNQQMERQTQLMQRQLAEVTARPPYDPRGSQNMAPTGHAAGFMSMANYMNYGGYYQQPRPRQR